MKKFWLISIYILSVIMTAQTRGDSMLNIAVSPQTQDQQFRTTIVGQDQVGIEKALIEAKNGVFVLFTPSFGTPQMISPKGIIPEGLIPQARLASYEDSVKPRVETTAQMPDKNVKCIYIHHQKHRAHVNDPSQSVDEANYKARLKKHPNHIMVKFVSEGDYLAFRRQDIPAAFYYYLPQGSNVAQFAAIFGKQINAPVGNQLSDPGCYFNREQDLKVVNSMLKANGFQPIDAILEKDKIQDALLGSYLNNSGQRRSARLR